MPPPTQWRMPPFHRHYVCLSMCVSHASNLKTVRKTRELEIELTSQLDRVAAISGIEAEKLRHQYDANCGEIEPWLLLNVNRKSQSAYHLPWLSASPKYKKEPKLSSALTYRFAAVGRYRLLRSISKPFAQTQLIESHMVAMI